LEGYLDEDSPRLQRELFDLKDKKEKKERKKCKYVGTTREELVNLARDADFVMEQVQFSHDIC